MKLTMKQAPKHNRYAAPASGTKWEAVVTDGQNDYSVFGETYGECVVKADDAINSGIPPAPAPPQAPYEPLDLTDEERASMPALDPVSENSTPENSTLVVCEDEVCQEEAEQANPVEETAKRRSSK